MKLDSFLHFIITHNETIILLTIGLMCALSALIVFRQVFKKGEFSDQPDFSKIEATLKKILSQTNGAIQMVSSNSAAGTAINAEGVAVKSDDSAGLMKELEERAVIITDLKNQIEAAKASEGAGSNELLVKIKTLEGKLAEYEIIEDDIADLSHYKDENARLKKEIEQFKRGGPELVDQFAAAVATQATAAPEVVSSAVAPMSPADSAAQIASAVQAVQPQAGVAGATPSQVGETLEFDKNNAKVTPPAPAAPPASATPAAAAPAVEVAAATPAAAEPPTMKDTKTDIFAEFTPPDQENPDPLAELGEIDTNRMLEELKDLNVDMQAGADSLDEAPDMDKMAEEALKLAKKNG